MEEMKALELLIEKIGRDAVADLVSGAPCPAPVGRVRWVEVDRVRPNDYNPNAVASPELKLLHTSIMADGYTQPVVVVAEGDDYVIVDGFHRYYVAKNYPDVRERYQGKVPVVVLEKTPNERMAATVRHNRARGKHSIKGMSNLVYQMLANGASDEEIARSLGMEAEELFRLKHVTGIAKLLQHEYGKSWKTRRQVVAEKAWRLSENAEEP
jgi:ParB-like chromosome segregation protein Spo0J